MATKTPAMPIPTMAKPGAASRARSNGDVFGDLMPRVCGTQAAAACRLRGGAVDPLCGAGCGFRLGRPWGWRTLEARDLSDYFLGLPLLERSGLQCLEDE